MALLENQKIMILPFVSVGTIYFMNSSLSVPLLFAHFPLLSYHGLVLIFAFLNWIFHDLSAKRTFTGVIKRSLHVLMSTMPLNWIELVACECHDFNCIWPYIVGPWYSTKILNTGPAIHLVCMVMISRSLGKTLGVFYKVKYIVGNLEQTSGRILSSL